MRENNAARATWNGMDVYPDKSDSASEMRHLDQAQSAGAAAPEHAPGQTRSLAPRINVPLLCDLDQLPSETISVPASSRIAGLKKGASMGADRLRLLRMRLWELRRIGNLKTIAVTSALPKDGKSTIALNVATVLADGNRHKVLLIEADLHCPSIGKNLKIGNRPGLAECLDGAADPFRFIRRIDPMGWFLMQAGHTENHPTDLMQSQAFPDLLARVALSFDWVIIDTPPVFPVADTMSICQTVDGVLVVVRSNVTPRESVEEAVEMVGTQRIAAIVLNGAEDINRSYYKYSSYYYGNSAGSGKPQK